MPLQTKAATTTASSSSSPSSFSSPYYSRTTFYLLSPLAVLYSVTLQVGLKLWSLWFHHSLITERWIPPSSGGWIRISSNSNSNDNQHEHEHNNKNYDDATAPTTTTTTTTIKPQPPQPHQRIALVTGSNTGIGYETARTLVVEHNFHVILACRSRIKAERAVAHINRSRLANNGTSTTTSTGTAVFVHPLDLSSPSSIRAFVHQLRHGHGYTRLDVLINNAGCNSSSSVTTSSTDNKNNSTIDFVFQANFLGHVLLTAELMPLLQQATHHRPARIVNVSSVMHHFCGDGFRFDQVEAWKLLSDNNNNSSSSNNNNAYSLSKLAALLWTGEINRRYNNNHNNHNNNIVAVAVNPGAVHSDIWRDSPSWMRTVLGWFLLTPSQGCRTSVAATILDLDPFLHVPTTTTLHRRGGEAPEEPENSYHNYYPYLQPYWQPFRDSDDNFINNKDDDTTTSTVVTTPLFPVLEMLGPYQGYRWTVPRLPPTHPHAAGRVLWQAAVELTGAVWPEP